MPSPIPSRTISSSPSPERVESAEPVCTTKGEPVCTTRGRLVVKRPDSFESNDSSAKTEIRSMVNTFLVVTLKC